MTKERPWANGLGCSKTSNSLEKIHIFHMFFTVFPPFLPKSESLPLLFAQSHFFKERPWAKCSGRSGTNEQPWAIRSRCSLKNSDSKRFAQVADDKRATGAFHSFSQVNRFSLTKNEWFAQKTDEQIPSPAWKWWNLLKSGHTQRRFANRPLDQNSTHHNNEQPVEGLAEAAAVLLPKQKAQAHQVS